MRQLLVTAALFVAALVIVESVSTILERFATRGHNVPADFSPIEDEPHDIVPSTKPAMPQPPPATPAASRSPI